MSEEMTDRPLGGEHARALVESYLLLDRAQQTSHPIDLGAAGAVARRQGWGDVEFFLHYALYAQAELTGADMAGPLEQMEELAPLVDDDALTAVVWACQAQRAADETLCLEPLGDSGLAAAVAVLDDGGGSALHRPVAWIECALAYRTLGLWELEEEMLASAALALAGPWPSGLEPMRDTSLRCVAMNRVEARAQRVCELLELDERRAAAELAGDRSIIIPISNPVSNPVEGPLGAGQLAGVRASEYNWRSEVAAVRSVLDAAAGRRDRTPAAVERTDWGWSGYPSCFDLARAVRASQAGRAGCAADWADRALVGMEQDCLPALRLLALALAAGRPPVSAAARRYAREQARLRATARRQVLRAAQVQRAHERLRREHQVLERRANVDQLTGVANRHAYAQHLDRLRRHQPDVGQVGVMVVDVDWFKTVNDRYGHGVGDQVLRGVAGTLAANVRACDLVARLGGDEFVVLFDIVDPSAAAAEAVAARARRMIDDVLGAGWGEVTHGLTVSVSAGFAVGPCEQVDTVIDAADRALYQAKERGRGRLVGS